MDVIEYEEHIEKNRYPDIIPNSLNLSTLDGKAYADSNYFNGNYIMNREGKVNFIATQGPLRKTTEDFWNMIMLNNVNTIIGKKLY